MTKNSNPGGGPLYLLYTMVQKSQKWPKTQIQGGGPALIVFQLVSVCLWNEVLVYARSFGRNMKLISLLTHHFPYLFTGAQDWWRHASHLRLSANITRQPSRYDIWMYLLAVMLYKPDRTKWIGKSLWLLSKHLCNHGVHVLFFLSVGMALFCPDLRQDPPLDWSFWSFLTFLHHGIEEVEKHLLWKFYKKIRRKRWSNVPPKLLACIGFLYKVVHKIGRLRKFNRSREIEFNFLTAWTISMKFGTLVQHAPGYKTLPQIF